MSLLSFAIFGSWVWAAIFAGILLILLFTSEALEQGFIALVSFVVFLLINHFWGNIPVFSYLTWVNIGVYLGLGFVFSIFRVFFYGRKQAKTNSKPNLANLGGNVCRWWFLWPVSALVWILSYLAKTLWDFIYQLLGHGFEYILELGFRSAK